VPELRSDDGLQLTEMIARHEPFADTEVTIPLGPDKETPAHPAARIITEASVGALDRQITQLGALDAKASYLGAATFALLAGFVTALATKPPTSDRLQDLAALSLVFAAVALGLLGYTWWPRPVDIPPHPRGLRERHWNDPEEAVLRAISDSIATTFDGSKAVERKKAIGIKFGILSLAFATVLGTLDILLIISPGGSH